MTTIKKEMTLNEIRQIELGLLHHFKTFCEQHKITYFLSNGTLLGAVKYGGFIPWDDDIDVFVPRSNYNRLMEEYVDSERYRLFSFKRNQSYRYPFAKLCDMTTEKVEDNIDNGVRLGIDIDIFPLDDWPNQLKLAEIQVTVLNKDIQRLNFLKCAEAISENQLKRVIKNVLLILLRPTCSLLVQRMEQRASTYSKNLSPVWRGCVVWCIYGKQEIIPASIFEGTVYIKFEDDLYPAPVGYDQYLRSLYGDYMADPPLEKQQSHHRYRAYYL